LQSGGQGAGGGWWAQLAERLGTGNVVTAMANRTLEIMLYPIDKLSGDKYIESEQRALDIEKKKRAQGGPASKIEDAAGDQAPARSAHVRSAIANTTRSIYYSSVADEAARFLKMKKEWRDPDFPPESTSMFSSSTIPSPFSTRLCATVIVWEQPRYFCSGSRTRGLNGAAGAGRGASAEPSAWFVSDWGSWDLSGREGGSSPVAAGKASGGKGGGRGGVEVDRYVGTCVVAALQDDPTLCDDVLDLRYIAQGICGVGLYCSTPNKKETKLSMVYIDTHFPCAPGSRLIFGAHICGESHVRDAWPAAVEKAIAKTYGSYQAISGSAGICVALTSICGNDVASEDLRELRGQDGEGKGGARVWKQLCSETGALRLSTASLVLAGSRSVLEGEDVDMQGISRGCTYHVLQAVESGGQRMVRLACPLVSKGKWAGTCPLAQSNEIKHLEKTAAQPPRIDFENAFWMPFGRFLSLFDIAVFSQRRRGGGGSLRSELLHLFGDSRGALIPGVLNRKQCVQEGEQAEKFASELIKQEYKEKKRSANRKSAAHGKKK